MASDASGDLVDEEGLTDLTDLPENGDLVITTLHGQARPQLPRPTPRQALRAALAVSGIFLLVLCAQTPSVQQAWQHLTTSPALTPMPLPAPLVARAPVVLPPSGWEHIPLPVPSDRILWYTPSPTDPATLYLCAQSAPHPDTAPSPREGVMQLWRTRDTARHWTQLTLPARAQGSNCIIQIAHDDPEQVAMLVQAASNYAQACEQAIILLSDTGGDSWRRLATPRPVRRGEGSCLLVLTRHQLYLRYSFLGPYQNGVRAPEIDALVRSDDGGATWVRADSGLGARFDIPAAFASGVSGNEMLLITAWTGENRQLPMLYTIQEGGRNWRRVGALDWAFEAIRPWLPPTGSGGPRPGRPLYTVQGQELPAGLFRLRAAQTDDLRRWYALPPLPVLGASLERTGLTDVLGVAPDGRLLAFGVAPLDGVDPRVGIPAEDFSEPDRPPWLWVWNPAATRWEQSPTPLPISWPRPPHGCGSPCWISSVSSAPNGVTYLWVMGNLASATSLFRIRVPDAAGT